MKDYYVGIDLGTDSIGWAVTDEEYNIPKFNGNAMWGIRLLDSGKTAQERRIFRCSRRRNERNKFRQSCLEILFNEEISKKDSSFFQRIKDSALYDGDKTVEGKYSIFNAADYNDVNYHKDYPTIYHLRKELIENKNPHDIRLVYLAVSNIIKKRGHFLFDTDDLGNGNNSDFEKIWVELNKYIRDNEYYDENSKGLLNCNSYSDVEKILKDRTLTTTKKKDLLTKELNLNKKENDFEIAVITLLSGGTIKAKAIFNTDEYDDSEAKSITFKSNYDEKLSVYMSVFNEKFELIEKIKAVYDWAVLADILNGENYISFAKVDTYEKHKENLKLLKEYVKKYIPEKYNLIFNSNNDKTSNYLAYSGYSKKKAVVKKCSQEKFCEFLKKQLPNEVLDEKYQDMYDEIASGTFMPKAVTEDNAVIPMQLNRNELKAILNNAEKYLPFLNDKDNTGKTVSDKIIDIFNFRIPYYVGPLNKHSDKSWVVRSDEKIYPWNFEKVVDIDKSAQNFIENLTSKCTYLPREDVIPKCSLLYSAYMVLNELNNLKFDGDSISVELKQEIYNNLFLKGNKVTNARLKKYLVSVGYSKDVKITGVDGDFKANLKPFRDLEFIDLPYSEKEEIIKAITVFGDDKKLLKKRLKNKYGDKLSDEEIAKISKLQYTGWSKLSKKFLTGIEAMLKNGTGEVTNIIHALWETNDNLMQLLSGNYDFKKQIDEENKNIEFTSLKQEIDNLYVSPKIKRPIYQTMQILEELVKIQGNAPKKIFIEVARAEEKKVPKLSRKQRLLDLYKNCQKEEKDLYEQLKNTSESDFKRDALYLYFTQFGRCMYTQEKINISDIYNRNLYDIDHIFPRSKIKDDSLDNRVLVTKKANEAKSNIYPVNSDIRKNMTPFWKTLLSKKLISEKKFNRLTRNYALTNDELTEFISRQLVETRQSTKAVAQLLKSRYPQTSVEYIKAGLVSDFRRDFDILKSREVNDYHHAKDAYLNIVVGNVYTTKARQAYFIDNIQSSKWSVNRMFDYSTNGVWEVENNKSLNIVKSTLTKNNIRFTRYAYKKKGGLFKETPLKKGSGQVPLKKGLDIDKYGGYDKASTTYFAFVEYVDSKGNTIRSFEPVDLYIEEEYLNNPQEFIKKRLGVNDVKIIIPRVKINALISIDGFRMHISGKMNKGTTLACKPAIQLAVSQKQERYIKRISKYLEKCAKLNKEVDITSFDELSAEENLDLFDTLLNKMNNTIFAVKFSKLGNKLENKRDCFESLPLYNQCYTLMQIINILHANVLSGDLTALVGSKAKNSGALTISNKLQSYYKSVKIINQSITGLFEQEIDLLK